MTAMNLPLILLRVKGGLLAVGLLGACAHAAGSDAAAAPHSAAALPQPTAPHASGPLQRVVLVTVDGLTPETYLHPDAHGLAVPTLRRLVREGAYADGARSVFPTNTYPAHTSIASGTTPLKHGIVANRIFDPFGNNQDAFYWYAEDIRVPPLWELARRAGLSSAIVHWPVSVGARVDWLVPEFWRARQPEDLKLVRALSTPGLLDEVQREQPDLYERLVPPTDSATVDIVLHLLRHRRPNLVLAHISQVDRAQHEQGVWSPAALAAIENADAQLGRLLQAIDALGIASETALVVASDHGFTNVTRLVNPGALLREGGLLTLDAQQKLSSYRATLANWGGLSHVYAREGEDEAALEGELRALFEARRAQPNSGIARVYGRDELRARGGDGRAVLAVEAERGVYFGTGLTEYEGTPTSRGMHGHDPDRPEMQASLLWLAPGVRPGLRQGTQLVDIAPTVARWLGLTLEGADGRALD